VIGQHDREHGFGDGDAADADAGVVAARIQTTPRKALWRAAICNASTGPRHLDESSAAFCRHRGGWSMAAAPA